MKNPRQFRLLISREYVDRWRWWEEPFSLVRLSLQPCPVQHDEDAEHADDEGGRGCEDHQGGVVGRRC